MVIASVAARFGDNAADLLESSASSASIGGDSSFSFAVSIVTVGDAANTLESSSASASIGGDSSSSSLKESPLNELLSIVAWLFLLKEPLFFLKLSPRPDLKR